MQEREERVSSLFDFPLVIYSLIQFRPEDLVDTSTTAGITLKIQNDKSQVLSENA